MTANEVDRALAAPVSEVGQLLLELHEDQWFERKASRIQPKDLGVTLIAFANAEGGVIVVGLSSGSVEGVRHHARKLNDFRQTPMDFTSPPVRAHFDQVRCITAQDEQDTVLMIRVDPANEYTN